jgi:hypothetical protein
MAAVVVVIITVVVVEWLVRHAKVLNGRGGLWGMQKSLCFLGAGLGFGLDESFFR